MSINLVFSCQPERCFQKHRPSAYRASSLTAVTHGNGFSEGLSCVSRRQSDRLYSPLLLLKSFFQAHEKDERSAVSFPYVSASSWSDFVFLFYRYFFYFCFRLYLFDARGSMDFVCCIYTFSFRLYLFDARGNIDFVFLFYIYFSIFVIGCISSMHRGT